MKRPDGMKPVSVCESDSLVWRVELNPEVWEAGQRLVTEAEYARIQQLIEYRKELQRLLAEIDTRPEYEPLEESCDNPTA